MSKPRELKSEGVRFQNRYRDTVTIRRISDVTWLFDVDGEGHWRFGNTFVDPAGGPFVSVGVTLSRIHPKLPADRQIAKIAFGPYDVDSSGYEYSGWLLHTEPVVPQ
jgi:hypothetical protein